jgi:hypothetical protein
LGGLYNQGVITNEADPTAYANTNLFFAKGLGGNYNSWNVANGSELIDPVTRQVRRCYKKYTPERWEDYAFQASVRSEKFNYGWRRRKNKLFHFIWLFERSRVFNSDFERLSTRVSINHEVKSWLKGGVNFGYSYSKSNNNGQSEDSGSVFWFADNMPSIYPLLKRS